MDYRTAVLEPEDVAAFLAHAAADDWRIYRIFPIRGSQVFIVLQRERAPQSTADAGVWMI